MAQPHSDRQSQPAYERVVPAQLPLRSRALVVSLVGLALGLVAVGCPAREPETPPGACLPECVTAVPCRRPGCEGPTVWNGCCPCPEGMMVAWSCLHDASLVDASTESAPRTELRLPEVPPGGDERRVFGSVDVAVPKDARLMETSLDAAEVYLSPGCPGNDEWSRGACVSVTLANIHAAAPASLSDAKKEWDTDVASMTYGAPTAAESLGEGVTSSGVYYAIRKFEVRVGFSSKGTTVHTWKSVSRVFGLLPVSADRHVRCTGYVESGGNEASIRSALNVCTSMHAKG